MRAVVSVSITKYKSEAGYELTKKVQPIVYVYHDNMTFNSGRVTKPGKGTANHRQVTSTKSLSFLASTDRGKVPAIKFLPQPARWSKQLSSLHRPKYL